MSEASDAMIRKARTGELDDAARLLHDFNREFDEPTLTPAALTERLSQLVDSGDTIVLLIGKGPDGLAVLRFRPAIWSRGLECHLAELYVVPECRGKGRGRMLMESVIEAAASAGAESIEVAVDEPDLVARALYESLGFANRTGGPTGPLMFVYELDLRSDVVPSF